MTKKLLLFFISLILLPASMHAYTPCPLDKALNAREDNHKKIYTLDSSLINICIQQIEKHASNYPPSFKNTEEKNLVIKDLVTLTNMIRAILENGTNNTEISLVYGVVPCYES